MIVNQRLTNSGTPTTGLSADITIYEEGNGTPVVSAQSMSEYGNGLYYYDFTTYNQRKRYEVYIDGSATLSGTDRYKFQELAYVPI